MLTVACVCVPGGIYDDSHIARLKRMVRAHLGQPYKFDFISQSDKPGWWAKVDLFKPGRFTGRVLYLDLDVTVVGSLDEIAAYPDPFIAIRDYQYPLTINTSVMAWDAGYADAVFTDFTPDVMNRLHGDQNWIHEKAVVSQIPRAWCPSYRPHIAPPGKVPADAKVIVFHGRPKPWEVPAFA